jgi:CPA2 family monovalent cation:H+ antiporter-2
VPHETTLIATIAGAFVFAFALGLLALKLRLPPLVGYLVAGIVIGPFTPGFVGDLRLAAQLAELGVILLMFGVGLHFSIKDLLAVRGIAVPGAIAQITTATLIGAVMASFWGWDLVAGLTFGLALSVASTVVLLRALERQRKLETPEGRIAVGWLIVEDLAMVLALVLLPAVAAATGVAPATADVTSPTATGQNLWLALSITLAKVALFVAFALLVGTRVVPWLLTQVARTGSRELFTLAVLAIALGIAFGSAALFGVSFALGAFFAGVILSESELSHRAGEDSLPLQDAFAVLFFVSVGMLFDPSIVLRAPLELLGVLLVILVGKSIAAFVIVLLFRYPVSTALTVSASLAQIGEFSFILAALGVSLNLLPADGRDLILAGALLSITLNSFFFAVQPTVERWIRASPRLLSALERPPRAETVPALTPPMQIRDHAIVVGHGRVGSAVTPVLQRLGLPFVVIERDRPRFEALRDAAVPVLFGDATSAATLAAAGVGQARLLLIATPDSYQARRVLELAVAANPAIDVVIRTQSEAEFEHLRDRATGYVVLPEREVARAMAARALRTFGFPPGFARRLVEEAGVATPAADAQCADGQSR